MVSDTQQLPLSIQPVISYPREAQVGKTYLMTIDLQPSGDSEWLYEDEEYPIYCMLETSPLFSSKPVGEPAVVLHRFGGSYGAAQFLLTATQEEMEGEIKVTLVNGWGVPIKVICLDEIKITTIVTQKNIVDYIGIEQKQKVKKITPSDKEELQNHSRETYIEKWINNLENEIASYEAALQGYTRETFPRDWARMQNNLGNAYLYRLRGEKADNLETAIAYFQASLQVFTIEGFPRDWSRTQNNLANAYMNRIRGDRAENIELAIVSYQAALEVYTREAFPRDWAMIQNNLGHAYLYRLRGEKADNLERMIAHFQAALEVYTRTAFPSQWATIQNNLGTAYGDRIQGERADNLERAIASYQAALEVYTREAFPRDWAMTQNNLGNAYSDRIQGEKVENIESAIASYQAALQVLTIEEFPRDGAMTQNNLGNAYSDRIQGDRAENLERAIASYQAALQVYTREAFPRDWAGIQNNLGNVYSDRIRGEKPENIESAIASYQAALQVLTIEEFPRDWAMTQNNLGNAYSDRIRGEKEENLERAIAYYQAALQVYTCNNFTREWAGIQNNLGNVYSDRTEGEKAENRESAIAYYQAALEVYTREMFPREWAEVYNNLKTIISLDLVKFYQACNPGSTLKFANPQEQKYYIDFSSVRGGNTIKEIGRTITRLFPNKPTCQLFTGHIGCGKSTELLRLKAELEAEGFHVVYFESSDDLEMADVDIADVLLAIARRISQSLADIAIAEPKGLKQLLKRTAELLQTEYDLSEVELGLPKMPGVSDVKVKANDKGALSLAFGIGKITAKAQADSGLRERLNQFLGPKKAELLAAINQELIEPAIAQLQQQGKQGLVVIVDNLDRIESQTRGWGRSQQEYIFIDQAEYLQKFNCHVVYTMPWALKFTGAVTQRYKETPKVLPMVQVQQVDGSDCEEGMRLLRQMVLARALPDLDEQGRLNRVNDIFDHPESLDRLCRVSGGHVRDLLQLLIQWLKKDLKQGRLTRETLEGLIRSRRNEMTLTIDDYEWGLLRKVRERKQVSGDDEYKKLIDSRLVYGYHDGSEFWFDINPILAEAEEFQL